MDWSASVLSSLASVTARSLILFGVAAVAILVFRVKAAAARHAVWTAVTAGLLLLSALSPALPRLPLHVLKVQPLVAPLRSAADLPTPVIPAGPGNPSDVDRLALHFTWEDAGVAGYALGVLIFLGRLAVGYFFTRRLVRAAAPVPQLENVYSSGWISVPLTIGHKILLPEGWESWEAPKLRAVLAHERTHVRRRDWAIALIAGVARSIYWFHPLAWWVERRLATLAEEACDDSALLLVESQPYAQALLDMAAAVNTAQGRVVWEAMAMAKAAAVRKRIERILDETRQIPADVTGTRWAALLACSVPLVWLVSVAQLAPAVAQEPVKTPAAMSELLKGRRQLSPGDVSGMEQYLVSNPQDVDVRSQLILYYYANGVREPRISHILWLIANRPQADAAVFTSQGILPRDTYMNTVADYQRVVAAWKQAVATRQSEPWILGNAARFFQASGDYDEAETLLKKAAAQEPGANLWKDRLGKLYAAALLGATGDPGFPNPQPSFAERVRSEVSSSEDGNLLFFAGSALVSSARRPELGQPVRAGVLNLAEHPLLTPAIEFGRQLLERASQFGGPRVVLADGPNPFAPATGVVGGVPGGVSGGVIGGIIGSAPAPAQGGVPTAQAVLTRVGPMSPMNAQVPLSPAPPVIKKVDPQYPALALQARISGVVKLRVTIGTDGAVKHMEVISGHPLLVPAAMESARQWAFQPPASDVTSEIDIDFTLPPGMRTTDLRTLGESGKKSTAPTTIKIGGNVQASKLIHSVEPIYPPLARAEGIEGSVTLTVTIGQDGEVQTAEPFDGNPILAAAAQDAVKQWRYQPTLLNGQPVTVVTNVVVPFHLR